MPDHLRHDEQALLVREKSFDQVLSLLVGGGQSKLLAPVETFLEEFSEVGLGFGSDDVPLPLKVVAADRAGRSRIRRSFAARLAARLTLRIGSRCENPAYSLGKRESRLSESNR